MRTIIAATFVLLGLAIGFVIAWVFRAGSSLNLLTSFLLVVAGAIIGFVVEWYIDEAYRRNRELRRQVSQPAPVEAPPVEAGQVSHNEHSASETLAEVLNQREEEVQQLRERVAATNGRINDLRQKFEAYQQTHPDDLTVIKGIGPVYQRKLRDIGFNSYDQLVTAEPDQLRRMLDIKHWQRVDVESWIEQARDWAERVPDV